MFKKIGIATVILGIGLLVGTLLLQKCCVKNPVTHDEAYKVIEEVYRPPLIKLPFTKDKQPIEDERLPIPKEQIKKTIEVDLTELPPGESKKIDLIVDQKGNVWVATDTSEKARVKVKKWKPKFLDVEFRFAYSLAYNGDSYHCLSADLLRIGSHFHIGTDLGMHIENGKIIGGLFGISVKYAFAELSFMNKDIFSARVLAGYNFLNQQGYVGFGFRW